MKELEDCRVVGNDFLLRHFDSCSAVLSSVVTKATIVRFFCPTFVLDTDKVAVFSVPKSISG